MFLHDRNMSCSGSFDGLNSQKHPEKPAEKPVEAKKRKLSYKEQRELDGLPAQMEALEAEQAKLQEALADGSLYASDGVRAAQYAQRAAAIDDELLACLERLDALGS